MKHMLPSLTYCCSRDHFILTDRQKTHMYLGFAAVHLDYRNLPRLVSIIFIAVDKEHVAPARPSQLNRV